MIRGLQPLHRSFVMKLLRVAPHVPGIAATSWFRTVDENVIVGGHPRSQHLLGFAVDLVAPASQLEQLELFLVGQGLGVVSEPSHLHVQAYDAGSIPASVFGRFGAVTGAAVRA